jgi:hypothetical protein
VGAVPCYRHENYEEWARQKQAEWKLDVANFNQLDFRTYTKSGHPKWTLYWETAAQNSYGEFKKWTSDTNSPVGSNAEQGKGKQPNDNLAKLWTPVASDMVKLAQKLVAGLLVDWGANAQLSAKYRAPPYQGNSVVTAKALCARSATSSHGAQLWAVLDKQGHQRTTSQASLNGGWAAWSDDGDCVANVRSIAVGLNNAWAVTQDGALYRRQQAAGEWTTWSEVSLAEGPQKLLDLIPGHHHYLESDYDDLVAIPLSRSDVWATSGQGGWKWAKMTLPGQRPFTDISSFARAALGDGEQAYWVVNGVGRLYVASTHDHGEHWWGWTQDGHWNLKGKDAEDGVATICATERGSGAPVQLWAIKWAGAGILASEEVVGQGWTPWTNVWSGYSSQPVIGIASACQGDGRLAVWARTIDGGIHMNYEIKDSETGARHWVGWFSFG